MSQPVNTETGTFPSWEALHREASSLLHEAAGWGRGVDQNDPTQMLIWAREYLPRILEMSQAKVVR